MLKRDSSYKVDIQIRSNTRFSEALAKALMHNNTSDRRVATNVKRDKNKVDITIKAIDLNIMLAVNNSVMQAIKMIESVDKYE